MKALCSMLLCVGAASLLAGCGCDAVGCPAIDVTVQDRVTGRSVARSEKVDAMHGSEGGRLGLRQ